jgi:hypothetical protein
MLALECVSEKVDDFVVLQTFNAAHILPLAAYGREQTRAHGRTLDEHGARTADTLLAPKINAREAELIPQEIREARARRHVHLHLVTIRS